MRDIRTAIVLFFILFISAASYGQNGKILNKRILDLSETPIWEEVSENDTLIPEFKHLNNLEFYFITYLSDSIVVKGLIIEPKENGIYPVVIFNRGGNRDFSSLNIGTLIRYTSNLANEGYIIIGSNYRKQDEFGGVEIRDVLCLEHTIKELEKADSKRIGMFGWSRGGMMAYLALKESDFIKTAVIGNGSSDLFNTIEERPVIETKVLAECVPNYYQNKENELIKRSAIYWADELDPKSSLLILCGTEDQRVNYQQSIQMAARLEEIGYTYTLQQYPTDHFFSDYKTELHQELIQWFALHLN